MPLAVPVVPHHALGRGCAGKVRYRSIEAAQRDLLRLAEDVRAGRVADHAPGIPLNIYTCDACGFPHIGHRPKRLANA